MLEEKLNDGSCGEAVKRWEMNGRYIEVGDNCVGVMLEGIGGWNKEKTLAKT